MRESAPCSAAACAADASAAGASAGARGGLSATCSGGLSASSCSSDRAERGGAEGCSGRGRASAVGNRTCCGRGCVCKDGGRNGCKTGGKRSSRSGSREPAGSGSVHCLGEGSDEGCRAGSARPVSGGSGCRSASATHRSSAVGEAGRRAATGCAAHDRKGWGDGGSATGAAPTESELGALGSCQGTLFSNGSPPCCALTAPSALADGSSASVARAATGASTPTEAAEGGALRAAMRRR